MYFKNFLAMYYLAQGNVVKMGSKGYDESVQEGILNVYLNISYPPKIHT